MALLRSPALRRSGCVHGTWEKDAAKSKKWRGVFFLTTPMTCHFQPDSSKWRFIFINNINEITSQDEACTLPCAALVLQYSDHRNELQTKLNRVVSTLEASEDYNKCLEVALVGEHQVSENSMDLACTIRSRAMTIPKVMKLFMSDIEKHGKRGLWDSMAKMHAVITKGKDTKQIEWSFGWVTDQFEHGASNLGYSVRDLQGESKSGKVSNCLVAIAILQTKDYVFQTWLHDSGLKLVGRQIEMIKTVLDSPESFRDHTEADEDGNALRLPDFSWRQSLGGLSDVVFEVLEEMLYDSSHLETWCTIVKKTQDPRIFV